MGSDRVNKDNGVFLRRTNVFVYRSFTTTLARVHCTRRYILQLFIGLYINCVQKNNTHLHFSISSRIVRGLLQNCNECTWGKWRIPSL